MLECILFVVILTVALVYHLFINILSVNSILIYYKRWNELVGVGNSFAALSLFLYSFLAAAPHTLTDKRENKSTIYTLRAWKCVCVCVCVWDNIYACGRIYINEKTSPFNRDKNCPMWFNAAFYVSMCDRNIYTIEKIRKINRCVVHTHTHTHTDMG